MTNHDYHAQFTETMKNRHVCQHPGCWTVTLGAYCLVHIESNETGEAVRPPRHLPEEI